MADDNFWSMLTIGTAKQIQDFLLTTKTLMINGYSLNLASSKPLETVYFYRQWVQMTQEP
ncbi:MAG: hypothetical protein ACLS3V_06095 [Streptococcus sp.]